MKSWPVREQRWVPLLFAGIMSAAHACGDSSGPSDSGSNSECGPGGFLQGHACCFCQAYDEGEKVHWAKTLPRCSGDPISCQKTCIQTAPSGASGVQKTISLDGGLDTDELPSGMTCTEYLDEKFPSGCTPQCDSRECGPDPTCGKSCGTCGTGTVCQDGSCVATSPKCPGAKDCAGIECGNDPVCGLSCGTCSQGEDCQDGSCVTSGPNCPIDKDCTGRTCGVDPVCGVSCGTCGTFETCGEGDVCIEGQIGQGYWIDLATGIWWQDPPPACCSAWVEADAYCNDLALAGKGDWRLPTINELRSLVRGCEDTQTGGNCCISDQCSDPSSVCCDDSSSCKCGRKCWGDKTPDGYFWPLPLHPAANGVGWNEYFWSSTASTDDDYWSLRFDEGELCDLYKGFGANRVSMRCVRKP